MRKYYLEECEFEFFLHFVENKKYLTNEEGDIEEDKAIYKAIYDYILTNSTKTAIREEWFTLLVPYNFILENDFLNMRLIEHTEKALEKMNFFEKHYGKVNFEELYIDFTILKSLLQVNIVYKGASCSANTKNSFIRLKSKYEIEDIYYTNILKEKLLLNEKDIEECKKEYYKLDSYTRQEEFKNYFNRFLSLKYLNKKY